ncbi:MAG TPA: DinB family protein [Anaerolineales bacterium]|nr:DinB family protein [Anaerolineales bacterium]
MKDDWLNQEILDHFQRVFTKLREAVQTFPDEEWQRGDTPYQRPAGLAAHLLANIDYYTSGLTVDQFPWQKRMGVDWEDPDDSKLPSKALVLAYLDEMEDRVERWTVREDFRAEETLHPDTGKTTLGRVLYLLRHSEHHLAELSLELRHRGLLGPEWR